MLLARRPLVDRRVTQTGSVLWSRTCPSSQPLCVFSLIERDPQTPNSWSNAGNAQAQGNQGRLLFGYFRLAAQEKVTSPGSATRSVKSHQRPWIPACETVSKLSRTSSSIMKVCDGQRIQLVV